MGHLEGEFFGFWDKTQSKLVRAKKGHCLAHRIWKHKDGFMDSYVVIKAYILSLFKALLSLSLSGLLIFFYRGTCFMQLCKSGRVILTLTQPNLHTRQPCPMTSPEIREGSDFSGSAHKIPGQGSDWSSLAHVGVPRPIIMAREMTHCDWPDLDYVFL